MLNILTTHNLCVYALFILLHFILFPASQMAETEFILLSQAQLGEATQGPRVTLRHGFEVSNAVILFC